MSNCRENTDKEIWREKEDDFYSPSIHVTNTGGIKIAVSGKAILMSVRDWHCLQGRLKLQTDIAIGAKGIAKQLQDELDDYHNAEKFVNDPPHDQVCCGCVAILRKQIQQLKVELKEIKDIYLGQIRVIARSRMAHKEKVERMVALVEQALKGGG